LGKTKFRVLQEGEKRWAWSTLSTSKPPIPSYTNPSNFLLGVESRGWDKEQLHQLSWMDVFLFSVPNQIQFAIYLPMFKMELCTKFPLSSIM
jgi:hypothetical protein